MESSNPLHSSHVHKPSIIVNRSHFFLQCTAVSFLVYYRAFFFLDERRDCPVLLWLVVFIAELVLFAIWLLERPLRLRPVSRTVFVERLPGDEELPSIDVFVFTADPKSEPTLHVMNTVLSVMAMDYPPEKVHVYLSDDGGSELTLNGMREAWRFARHWIPFCRRFRVAKRCPEAYFEADAGRSSNEGLESSDEFLAEREKIDEKYQEFKESLNRFSETFEDNSGFSKTDHPSVIEVIQGNPEDEAALPSLIYVSREKRPSHHHYFKAGAINTILRVSGVMTNSPFILGLDCDMHCNDPTSLRQAMCFHLDPDMSPKLAFVQFPHRFHTVARNDIYDSQLRIGFSLLWQGFDGLDGPVLSGTNYVIKRVTLYGSNVQPGIDPLELKKYFGPSNEFIKSLSQQYNKPVGIDSSISMLEEAKFLASCTYGSQTKWGHEVGFLRHSVTEDYLTSFALKSSGWKSVYLSTSVPQFLGSGVTNLNDLLTQATRWSSGLFEVGISKFSPLTYGPSKMSFLERMSYAYLSFFPLYFLSLWCFAIIPQLCLLNGIFLYPKVSSSYFVVFLFIFASAHAQHFFDVFTTGGSFRAVMNEQRMWMIKSVTSHMYGSFDALMKRIGAREATFSLTNKAGDDEKVELYQKGLYDFRSLPIFLVPIAFIVELNVMTFLIGIGRAFLVGDLDETFVQVFISFYILFINYPLIEGMVFRKDKGCFPKSVTILSAVLVSMGIFMSIIVKFLMY